MACYVKKLKITSRKCCIIFKRVKQGIKWFVISYLWLHQDSELEHACIQVRQQLCLLAISPQFQPDMTINSTDKYKAGKCSWCKLYTSIWLNTAWAPPGHVKLCMLVAWHSGRTSVFGRRTFPVLRSTCSWWVTTYVGKPSATGQPNRPTQPFILLRSINE